MLKDREKLYQAYHTLLSMALTWAFVLICNQHFDLRIHLLVTGIYSLIPALLVYFFDLNKKNLVSYLLLLSIIPILALIFWIIKVNPIDWVTGFVNWINTYNGDIELYRVPYANIAMFGVGALGAIIFYILTIRQETKIILTIGIITTLVILSINKINVNKTVIAICIFYILTIVVELYGAIYNKKTGRQDKKEGILYLAPICLLLAVLSISLPSKSDPIQWKAVKRAYHNVAEQMEVWKTDLNYYLGNSQNEFGISLSGFSDNNGNLKDGGAKLVKDSKVALKLSGQFLKDPTYLIGSVSNIYTGDSWEKDQKSINMNQMDYRMDYAELICALTRQKPEVLQNNRFIYRNAMTVNFQNIKTKTFFYPLKTSDYSIKSKYRKLTAINPQITFSKGRGKGTNYSCTFYELNLKGSAFIQMLREADKFSYEDVTSVNKETAEWLIQNTIYNDGAWNLINKPDLYKLLKERAEQIKEQYSGLPEELPQRVKDLAIQITKDYDNNYDKLKAIEAYLMNYEYTLSPGKVPKDQDFVDYFLFDNKKGYCTSFATAMAVLTRCIGIPSRYIEGYIANYKKKTEGVYYEVRNNQAHAWAEAYLEGIGWIPFEATAPYFDTRYNEWEDLNKNAYAEVSADIPMPYNYYQENMMQQTSRDLLPNTIGLKEKNNLNRVFNNIIIFLVTIAVLMLTITTCYKILRYRYNKVFQKADYNKKMYMIFLRILMLLKREGFELAQQETILMLAKRVKNRFCYEQITFLSVAEIYMQYRYGQEDVTKSEFEQVNCYYQGLNEKKKDEEKKYKVWFEELVFLAKKGNR